MKKKRVAGITIIGMAVTCLMIIVLVCLFAYSFSGVKSDSPTVVFYGQEGAFPQTSIRNSLAAAGYDFCIATSEDVDEDTGLYEIPDSVNEKPGVVVAALGNSAITALKSFADTESVTSIILIDPVYEGNIDMEGFGTDYPSKMVAVFEGKSNPDSVYDLSAGAIIYERLSGADTLYGSYSKQDKLLASKHYTNAAMDRFLSVSAFSFSDPSLVLFEPVFQSELSNFLGATGARTSTWYILLILSSALGISGLLMAASAYPMSKTTLGSGTEKKYDRRALVILCGMILAFVIFAIVLALIGQWYTAIEIIVPFCPVFMLAVMTLCMLPVITNKKVQPHKTQVNKPYVYVMVAVEILFFVLVLMNLTDFTIRGNVKAKVISIVFAGIADFVCVYFLVLADRKSLASNQGRCSYFGRKEMLILTFIPAVFIMLFGMVFSVSDYARIGFLGLFAALVPYLMTFSIKNHSGSCVASALVHSVAYSLILVSIL